MYKNVLNIKSNLKNYTVFFEQDDEFIDILSKQENTIFVIDKKVWTIYKDTILKPLKNKNLIILTVAEKYKNIETVCKLYSKIMTFSPRKNLNLVSIGGGITQDLTGFVASSLYRGIKWIFIPTTLLAQVDSCIGAKTSLNFKEYKNLVGTFYPPNKIFIYPKFLKTLNTYDFYSGVGEMAKLHLISGKNDTIKFIKILDKIGKYDFNVLLKFIRNCLKIKKMFIENDEFDIGKRNMLNYGHCIGHAIESATNFIVPHGQAIVMGMILANKESVKRNLLSIENETFIRTKLLEVILKIKNVKLNTNKIVKAMRQDKKNLGKGLALVMLKDKHEMLKITDLSEKDAKKLIDTYKGILCHK